MLHHYSLVGITNQKNFTFYKRRLCNLAVPTCQISFSLLGNYLAYLSQIKSITILGTYTYDSKRTRLGVIFHEIRTDVCLFGKVFEKDQPILIENSQGFYYMVNKTVRMIGYHFRLI